MNMHSPLGVRIAANGRMVLPKEARAALGIEGEGRVVVKITDDGVVITSIRAEIARGQALYRKHIKHGTSSEEFLEQRRQEAAGEEAAGR